MASACLALISNSFCRRAEAAMLDFRMGHNNQPKIRSKKTKRMTDLTMNNRLSFAAVVDNYYSIFFLLFFDLIIARATSPYNDHEAKQLSWQRAER